MMHNTKPVHVHVWMEIVHRALFVDTKAVSNKQTIYMYSFCNSVDYNKNNTKSDISMNCPDHY